MPAAKTKKSVTTRGRPSGRACTGSDRKRPRPCRADVEAAPVKKVQKAPVVAKRRRRLSLNDVHNSVLKVFVSHVKPNYSQPWCSDAQTSSTSSAWPVRLDDGSLRVVTNAHSVEHAALVQVKRHRHEKKYVAKVLCVGPDCDLALLDVPSDEFWKGLEPLDIRPGLPKLQDSVSVVGYPTGGESLSVTVGVVSRIDLVEYAQTGVTLLAVQIDAAINSGNSGGPVVDSKGNCVGVAFQNLDASDEDGAENIGYIIPTEIVRHFLEDYKRNGCFTGFGSAGILTQGLESPVLRQALGMTKTQSGVRIKSVEPASPAHGVLLPDDVVLSVDGRKVGNDGEVAMPWGRIPFAYLLNQRFPGESCELQVLRAQEEGVKKMSLQFRLSRCRDLVAADAGGPAAFAGSAAPRYIVAGGLVFVPLTKPFLEAAFGEDYADKRPSEMTGELVYLLENGTREESDQEPVVLTQVLASEVTVGYSDLENEVLETFNGEKVRNLSHLAQLLESSSQEKYQKFGFRSKEVVVLDRRAATKALPGILSQNMIPAARSRLL